MAEEKKDQAQEGIEITPEEKEEISEIELNRVTGGAKGQYGIKDVVKSPGNLANRPDDIVLKKGLHQS